MIRVLIVDDEPLARRGIRARLAPAEDVEIVGECSGGREAIRAIRQLAPDLIFLDVQMPGLDGFGVIDSVGPEEMPLVIFVTAFDEHAIRAFDAQAMDYLLKPIDDTRFLRTLERARRRLAERRDSALGRRLTAVLTETQPVAAGRSPDTRGFGRFAVKKRGRIILVPADDVDWIEAAGDYVRLHAGRDMHLIRETMGRMEEQLDPRAFVRIHRSTIVNLDRIRELRPHFNREYIVVLDDATELKLSRSYRNRLDPHFGSSL